MWKGSACSGRFLTSRSGMYSALRADGKRRRQLVALLRSYSALTKWSVHCSTRCLCPAEPLGAVVSAGPTVAVLAWRAQWRISSAALDATGAGTMGVEATGEPGAMGVAGGPSPALLPLRRPIGLPPPP